VSDPQQRALRLVQHRLERFYELERAPDVVEFVRVANDGSRESLVLRQSEDELEIALYLPPVSNADDLVVPRFGASDAYLQLMEGVSHFVYVAERARTNLPTTRLELELQAEVDKFVLLAFGDERLETVSTPTDLHGHLYERVRYLHPPDSEDGVRYRLANDLAARFVARLVAKNDSELVLKTLKRFYRAGQTEKIRLAQAA